MLIDFHAHTSGISKCCRIPAEKVLQEAKTKGLDGIVLTNHYQKSYVEHGDLMGFVHKYMEEIRYTQNLSVNMGLKVFWGIEVTMERHSGAHLLVYGVDEQFLFRHPSIFDMTQEELWRTVKQEGGVLIHAHPFRGQAIPMDPRYLDGVEINCHPLYGNTYSKELLALAKEYSLFVTCGGDYHADTYRPRCGVFIPDSIEDSLAIGRHILLAKEVELLVHEINGADSNRILVSHK